MKTGDLVRVVSVPQNVTDSEDFKTRSLLSLCIGRVFPVMGLEKGLIAIDVGELNGKPSYMETVFIEPECLQLVMRDDLEPGAPGSRS